MNLVLLALACAAPSHPDDTAGPRFCNNAEALCDRPVDQVTFLGTHNAMSSAEREWLGPNQTFALPTQLADGVRAFNLDLYDVEGVPTLCHGYCSLGSQPMADGLGEIATFLEGAPDNVLLITFESYISASQAESAFVEAGLADHVYSHAHGTPWPTLAELIDRGTPVVVFTSDGGGEPSWYHAQWDWWMDNPYAAQDVADFSCAPDRGSVDNDLYNMNHFLTAPIAMSELAATANAYDALKAHATACTDAWGRPPNQVLVDFYDQGDTTRVVNELNGVSDGS